MERKSISVIILIVFTLVVICLLAFNHASEDKFTVGDAEFTLPDGYKVKTGAKIVTISKGKKNFSITHYNDSNIDKYINDYKSNKEKINSTVTISNVTTNDKQIVKSTILNDTRYVHYWFNYNNKTYTIYTGNAGKDVDQTVFQMISSIDI